MKKSKRDRPMINAPMDVQWGNEVDVGTQSRRLSQIRKDAAAKEYLLTTAVGPSSLPDPHYPKSYFLKEKP